MGREGTGNLYILCHCIRPNAPCVPYTLGKDDDDDDDGKKETTCLDSLHMNPSMTTINDPRKSDNYIIDPTCDIAASFKDQPT